MSEINLYSKNMLRSMEELKKGRWNPGFNLYEYRSYDPIKIPMGVKTPLLRTPIWKPGFDVRKYNIVVTNEQGIGDTIMHSRFITLMRQIPVKSVHIAMQRQLNPLIAQIEGVDGIITDDNCTRETIRVKALSLPALMMQYRLIPDKQPDRVYGAEGYIKLNTEKSEKVGFCWHSHNSSWNAEAKKIPQEIAENFYKKLKKHKDVVSLQVQPDFMPRYLDGKDWLDTARKIAALDAIVTIDTGVAHLAGALGVRTINLIGAEEYAGWFYFPAQSPKTPWYDSMELIWYQPYTNWKAGLDEALRRLCR
jgi:ADP-heptose:LPS heptosyltransferase